MEVDQLSQRLVNDLIGPKELVAQVRGVNQEMLAAVLLLVGDGVAPHSLADAHQVGSRALLRQQFLCVCSTNYACKQQGFGGGGVGGKVRHDYWVVNNSAASSRTSELQASVIINNMTVTVHYRLSTMLSTAYM